jgi:uncharacterized protein YutE (UPF0331/DUF86 family)
MNSIHTRIVFHNNRQGVTKTEAEKEVTEIRLFEHQLHIHSQKKKDICEKLMVDNALEEITT